VRFIEGYGGTCGAAYECAGSANMAWWEWPHTAKTSDQAWRLSDGRPVVHHRRAVKAMRLAVSVGIINVSNGNGGTSTAELHGFAVNDGGATEMRSSRKRSPCSWRSKHDVRRFDQLGSGARQVAKPGFPDHVIKTITTMRWHVNFTPSPGREFLLQPGSV